MTGPPVSTAESRLSPVGCGNEGTLSAGSRKPWCSASGDSPSGCPHFAAFVLLDDDAGRAALSDLLRYSREALDGANKRGHRAAREVDGLRVGSGGGEFEGAQLDAVDGRDQAQ
jgi:hypothetical protein